MYHLLLGSLDRSLPASLLSPHLGKIAFFLGLLLISLSSCKKEPAIIAVQNTELNEIQLYYKSQVKESFDLKHSSGSLEAALLNFLIELKASKAVPNSLCSEADIKNLLLPNTYDSGTITSLQPPDQAWQLIKMRRDLALGTLRAKLNNTKNLEIFGNIPKITRDYHYLKGYTIKEFSIGESSTSVKIDEVKLVIEHNQKFKVCILGN